MDTPGADFSSTAIEILVNGEPYPAAPGASAFDVVAALGLAGRPLAVEVNEEVVPRARLAACMLKAGDRVEIVTLVGGG